MAWQATTATIATIFQTPSKPAWRSHRHRKDRRLSTCPPVRNVQQKLRFRIRFFDPAFTGENELRRIGPDPIAQTFRVLPSVLSRINSADSVIDLVPDFVKMTG